jgi:hypothetical protein
MKRSPSALWGLDLANRMPLATEQILGLRHVAFVRPYSAQAQR